MTLGEIIREYTDVDGHTISQFAKDSGLSRYYIHLLINNSNSYGGKANPSIETIRKVAKGLHTSFDDVFNRLSPDEMIRVKAKPAESDAMARKVRKLCNLAKTSHPEDVQQAIEFLKMLKKVRKGR